MPSAPSISYDITPSRQLSRRVCLLGVLALMAVWLAYLPVWLKLLLTISALVYIQWQLRDLRHNSVVRCVWGRDDIWMLGFANGAYVPAQLVYQRMLFGYIILHLESAPKEHHRFIVCTDNASNRVRRHLRIRLRSAGS